MVTKLLWYHWSSSREVVVDIFPSCKTVEACSCMQSLKENRVLAKLQYLDNGKCAVVVYIVLQFTEE